jgi:hypothetical protein
LFFDFSLIFEQNPKDLLILERFFLFLAHQYKHHDAGNNETQATGWFVPYFIHFYLGAV